MYYKFMREPISHKEERFINIQKQQDDINFKNVVKEINEIKQIGEFGSEEQKQNIINFYKTNIRNFINLFLRIDLAYQYSSTPNNYLDALFLDKTFVISLLQELNSNYTYELEQKLLLDEEKKYQNLEDTTLKQKKLNSNIQRLLKTKSNQNPNIFQTIEESLQEPFLFVNNSDYIGFSDFITLYNFEKAKPFSNSLITYFYHKSETMILNLILNANEIQQKRIINIFLSDPITFNYFVMNNDRFFNFINNRNTFLDILFNSSTIIQLLIENGNIPKIHDLLNSKINQPKVLTALKKAIYIQDYSGIEQDKDLSKLYGAEPRYSTTGLNTLYGIYSDIYDKLRKEFSFNKKFIKELDTKLLKPIYINDNEIYHRIINRLATGLIFNNDNLLTILLEDDKKQLDEFINLFRNNSLYCVLATKEKMGEFLNYLHTNHVNNLYLFNQQSFIDFILNDENDEASFNFIKTFYNTKLKYENYNHIFKAILADRIYKYSEYSEKINNFINESPKGRYNIFIKLFFSNLPFIKLVKNNPKVLTEFISSGDLSKQIDVIKFYNEYTFILKHIINKIQNSMQTQRGFLEDNPDLVYSRNKKIIQNLIQLYSVGLDPVMVTAHSIPVIEQHMFIQLSRKYDNLINIIDSNPSFMRLLEQDNEYINLLFETPFFTIRFMQQKQNESFVKLIENKIQQDDTFLNTLSIAVNLGYYNFGPMYENIINQCFLKDISKHNSAMLIDTMTHGSADHKRKFIKLLQNNIDSTINLMEHNKYFRNHLIDTSDFDCLFNNSKFLESFLLINKSYKNHIYPLSTDYDTFVVTEMFLNMGRTAKYDRIDYKKNIQIVSNKIKTNPLLDNAILNMMFLFKDKKPRDYFKYTTDF